MRNARRPDAIEYIDECGFINDWSPSLIQQYEEEIIPRHKNLNNLWGKYIESEGGIDKINIQSPDFKKMVRKGIGNDYRKVIWSKITSLDKYIEKHAGMYQNMLKLVDAIPPTTMRIIEVDLPRTWKDHSGFTTAQLKNVLCAFAVGHPEIGYCQGLNFFAAIFIIYLGEEPALWMLCKLVENYFPPDYFCNQLKAFQVDLRMIEMVIYERIPDVAKHAEELHHEWMLTASGWLLTLFSNSFPMATVMRIWDCFLLEGSKVIFRVCIAFLRLHHDEFLVQNDKIAINRMIYLMQSEQIDDDKLMDLAFRLKAFSKGHIIKLREAAKESFKADANVGVRTGAAIQKLFGLLKM